jgi:hypothetical protein
MYRKNIKRHVETKAKGGDEKHLAYYHEHYGTLSRATSEKEKGSRTSETKGPQAPQVDGAGDTRTPASPFDIPAPGEEREPSGEKEAPQDGIQALEFPEEPPGAEYVAVPEGEVVYEPEMVPYENWQLALETIFDLSVSVRDGDLSSLKKMTKAEYEILAKAIARRRGEDLSDTGLLMLAGSKFFLVVGANFVIGMGKMLQKARDKKAARIKAEQEAKAQEMKERGEAPQTTPS